MNKGKLYIISAPSGTGKSTVINKMLELRPGIFFSVSATTRAPRQGEVDGVNYLFMTREQFEAMIERGEFLEHAEYVGNCYGTPLLPITEHLEQGTDALLDIEVQGFRQIKAKMPEAVSVFIVPPSLEELERRLRGRGTDSDETIAKRLETAKIELQTADDYDYVVVNDEVDRTAGEILSIMDKEKMTEVFEQ